MRRRACGSRRCASSLAIGRRTTTGARSRRGSRRCRNSSPRSTASTSTSSTSARSTRTRLPIIVTHGWPGSIIEQLKIIEPADRSRRRTAASAADAFDVVIPSLPGHGFSGKPTTTGWDPIRIARAWVVLMERLGYKRYVAQGGDWGNAVTEQMALQRPPGLLGIHTNMPATIPDDIAKALAVRRPAAAPVSPPRSSTRGISSTPSTSTASATRRRWRTARRRCTRSRTRPSAWPRGCSTTTRPACADRARLRRRSRRV